MRNTRGLVLRAAIAVFVVFAVLTAVSTNVYRLMLPEVRRESVRIGADGAASVPQTGVYIDRNASPPAAYIYAIEETSSLWGHGYAVRRIDVEYIGEDFRYVSVRASGADRLDIALYPSRALYDGAAVQIGM
jgi:hypothetical protein